MVIRERVDPGSDKYHNPKRVDRVGLFWNLLTIAVFFFSHCATAAEKGDDRVSDTHADRHENIYHNGSSGFGRNADSAETADLGCVHI